ncbi:acyl-CoA dehydrogenase family protein [Actinokineospora sp.]|uniref:acyl-CoA dehydrogenase family protein n=1 Tax=Actinokineospora sp. TaxID=1872133 RepID=UPI004037C6DA
MDQPRDAASVALQLRDLFEAGGLDLPDPGLGRTRARWAALADLGRGDLALARLAEGHTDAVSILREAGREGRRGVLYGVWAARSGGTGAVLHDGLLSGSVRFCSGAHSLDRALVVASTEDDRALLLDVDLDDRRVQRHPHTWQPLGMDASDSPDVVFAAVPVDAADVVGPPGFYTGRPGFPWGGGGVAAVWHGGAAGIVARTAALLRAGKEPDEHQLAHFGALHTALAATGALLRETAEGIDADPAADVAQRIRLCRSSAEDTAREVVDRVPRITGPTPLARDRSFAQALADLQLYVRQHHAERDLAALGRCALDHGGTP